MSNQKVFLVGATGEVGRHVLNALIDHGSFDITCFIRSSSEGKPSTRQLRGRGVKVAIGDLNGPLEAVIAMLENCDTVISCMSPAGLKDQIPLVDAAVQAGVKRFLPCNWGTPSARGGILAVKDIKEEIHDYIFQHRLGYTIIDVGFWYQASLPRVPSGKFDSAIFMPINDVYAGGVTPNMLTDVRDVGRITAEIVRDERTLNHRVIAYGDVLSQNEIHQIIEDKTGEKLQLSTKTNDEAQAALEQAKAALGSNSDEKTNRFLLAAAQYAVTKYVRGDNTPENARYLGYIDANELFPDFKYRSYAEFIDEVIAGKIERLYQDVQIWKPS
ncbi:hypothetical protein AYO21_02543 [Fonsecaea monophora]|uniref:NmrA-like domain-containing protein n=1 Tax=Fonsecaea monophora TaxID=254056 RepID=A0A177FGJ1_9EURO|nr:hypothetical protein AYO21_02543 [Fonsecaea monophora]KAH0848457.1 isoflavone reductase family protein [Fonsecaea pedrosoi]OAG43257.1 hypothetical protein AYO21_02543 [Fonsecaea monophora]